MTHSHERPSPEAIEEGVRHHLGGVLPASHDLVCSACLGGKNPGYSRCHACDRLFGNYQIPEELRCSLIAISSAVEGRAWYARLRMYKDGKLNYAYELGAITGQYLKRHAAKVSEAIGGEPEALVVVPSKRPDRRWDNHPLRAVGKLSRPAGLSPIEALRYVGDKTSKRRGTYFPEDFEAGPDSIDGKRVILLEDTWVTGGTMLSAAGALLDHGAASVLPVVIARAANPGYWETQKIGGGPHTYWEAIQQEWDPEHWPR